MQVQKVANNYALKPYGAGQARVNHTYVSMGPVVPVWKVTKGYNKAW